MRIDILTLFPEMIEPVLGSSILGRAAAKGIVEFVLHNIRDYADNKHKTVDDYPFGGGAGMVMQIQPIVDCMTAAMGSRKPHVVYLSPRGKVLTSAKAKDLSKKGDLLLLCGHYEGIDERVYEWIDEEISIGDYVLTGGELPAMVLIDAVSRFIPGTISDGSMAEESFSGDGLLEYPQYTRPAEYMGAGVPDVLLSGHHANILAWKRQQSLLVTAKHRPDLLTKADLSPDDIAFLEQNEIKF